MTSEFPMKKLFYPAVFIPDIELGGYTVSFPDLPGYITEGDTLEEAISMAQEAAEGWLSLDIKEGKNIPEPRPLKDVVLSNLSDLVVLIPIENIEKKQ